MFALPAAARTACWLNAWLAGRASADDVIAGLLGHQAQVDFVGLTDGPPISPALLLGELRRRGVARVAVALPSPGDLIGLGGPAAFNADALEQGEAVILQDAELGLVPRHLGSNTRWLTSAARPATYLPDIGTADRALRQEILDVTERLVALDVSSWSPDLADALMNLRAPMKLDGPVVFASPEAARTAMTGLRCRQIVELALRDEGGAVTAAEMAERRAALTPLQHASRAALVAACSSLDGR